MIKRLFALILVLILIVPVIPGNVSAAADETRVVLEDGSYLIITLTETAARDGTNKGGRKTYNFYASDGTLKWSATLAATFNYTGTTATCTSAVCTTSIKDSAWFEVSKSTTRSGGTATTNLTMGEKVLGITLTTISRTITLTCDKDGNLS